MSFQEPLLGLPRLALVVHGDEGRCCGKNKVKNHGVPFAPGTQASAAPYIHSKNKSL